MNTATESKKAASIAPFAVEANHPRNCDLLVQGLTGICDRRLRSRLKGAVAVRGTDGKERLKPLSTDGIGPPEIPGMILHVHPAKGEIVVEDPLRDNEKLRAELADYFRQTLGTRQTNPPNGCEERRGQLDRDRMKTLCREILGMVEAGEMEWKKGPRFDQSDVDELPGEYLTNPGSIIKNNQPRYEKNLPAYEQRLNRLGD